MATLVDPPKANPTQVSDFVQKQLSAARWRVRALDFFLAGLSLTVASLVFLLVLFLVDRYWATPKGLGWAAVAAYVAIAGLYLYARLFHPSRRQINPYFAARQLEQSVVNAKNSLVTWVDLQEDERLPGSIRSAISQKAARDLKGVDINRAIENRRILWIGLAAVVLLLANAIVAFLPPTRTELTIEEPRKGDISVFNNQEVSFLVRVDGRIPKPGAADAVRLRLWYNPEDPETYEERPMQPVEGERRQFSLTIPPRQVRNGFQYAILAGDARTPDHTVTCKIIPEFTGFEVRYVYPAYRQRPEEMTTDPNLIAPYGTFATILASTNREVKSGYIEIEGQPRTIEGQLVDGRTDAIQFVVPMEREGAYRMWFSTPEGDKNQDPARFRLGVVDPRPVVRQFDVAYDYPAYLRYKPMVARDIREAEIEAPRGTRVTLTAKTTRGVAEARLEIAGAPPIPGQPIPDQPMWVRFTLPPLDKDAEARLIFTPTTNEGPNAPRTIPIRVLADQTPVVELTDPKEDTIQVPANGSVELKGLATDDHGINKMTLHMKVVGAAEDRYLQPRPYRGGISFLRKEDNSWPTRVEYRDFIRLPELRLIKDPNWRVVPGTIIEVWLEAEDNCAVEPGPNRGVSRPKRIQVLEPPARPEDKQKIEEKNRKLEQEQKQHEKKQDAANAAEKREVQQPPPKGAENPMPGEQQQPDGATDDARPKERGEQGPVDPKGGQPGKEKAAGAADAAQPPMEGDAEHANRTKEVEKALRKAEQMNDPAMDKPDERPTPDAKVDPSEARSQPRADGPAGADPRTDTPPAESRQPKSDPNQKMDGEPQAGEQRPGKIDPTREEKAESRPQGEPREGMAPEKGEDRPSFGGNSENASQPKPDAREDAKDPPQGKPQGVDKAEARKDSPRKEPGSRGSEERSPEAGANKPEREVAAADQKPGGEQGPKGNQPPRDAGASKPRETPAAGEDRPQPKQDEIARAGESRGKPMDPAEAGSDREPGSPMAGDNQQARGESRPGPGSPPPGSNEQGDLDRELGELERELNSTKPKMDPKRQSDVDRLMRNPETREKTRDKLDELERNAKDPLTRDKIQDARRSGEQAARNYDQEKPNAENVDELAKKLNSSDPRERREAEQRIKDWEKDQQAREDLKKETDELKKKDRSKGEKVEEARNKAEQARADAGKKDAPRPDEKQLGELARDLNSQDEKTRADAQQKLDQMMKDPKTRQETQDKLKEMADKAQGAEKQDLENAAKQAERQAKDLAAKDPPGRPLEGGKVDPKALQDAAQKLASNDPKERQAAQQKLDDMMKDPKAARDAEEKLKQMAQETGRTPEEKKALEDAAGKAREKSQELAKKADDPASKGNDLAKKDPAPAPREKVDPKQMEDAARKLASSDPKEREEGKKQLEDMARKNPDAAREAAERLKEMADQAGRTPEEKKNLEDAARQANEMAGKEKPPVDPKDLKDLAREFEKLDDASKERLKKQFDETLKDPARREEMRKQAQEMARNATPEQKKQFENMMREMAGGDQLQDEGTPDPADPRNRLKAAEMVLDRFKKNVSNEEFARRLGWTEEQKARWIQDQEATIEALRRQAEKGDWRLDRGIRAPVAGGPEGVKLDPKDGVDPLRGGRYAPPPGYADPYRKFTGGSSSDPKR